MSLETLCELPFSLSTNLLLLCILDRTWPWTCADLFPSGEEAEASEEESEHGIDAGNYVDDEYPEEAPEATGQELMEIDGRTPLAFHAPPGAQC